MARRRFTPEQIVNKLREVDLAVGRGASLGEAVRAVDIAEQTYYKWRKEYGGLKLDQTKRLKLLEKENVRLRKVVADMALDNAVLKEVSLGKF